MTDDQKIKTGRQIVLDAITDLHNQEQVVTTATLLEVTGLRRVALHEYIKVLVESEQIRRKKDGVFVPMVVPPPARAVSVTKIPESFTKIEIGDQCLNVWPREERMLGVLLAGAGQQYSNIQAGNEIGVLAVEMAGRMKKLERELAGYKQKAKSDDKQGDFEFDKS